MRYKFEEFENLSNGFDGCDKLKEVIFHDHDVIGMTGNEKPAFSFDLNYVEEKNIWAGFQIDLKQAIYLRNALNSFIEINATHGICTER